MTHLLRDTYDGNYNIFKNLGEITIEYFPKENESINFKRYMYAMFIAALLTINQDMEAT